MNNMYDCVVIGAGVSGMTAALYLKRANVNVLILDSGAPGGQINRTSKIENYPGYIEIDGPTLAFNMYEQLQKLNLIIKYGKVLEIEKKANFIIKTDIEDIMCRGIIIATGRNPKELGLENEKNLIGHGISWCALCDGQFYKEKEVCVIGGGNSALEEALYLSKICSKVTIIHRRDKFRADPILIEKVKTKENIVIIYNSVVNTLNKKNEKLESILINNSKKINCEGLFIYIGSKPNADFAKKLGVELDNEYIIVSKEMKTNINNVYACGDVIKKDLYQIVTATSEGAIAANSFLK